MTPSPLHSGPAREQLRSLFSDPGLARLVARLRQRMERGQTLTKNITLSGLTPAEREALERLLRRPPSHSKSLSIPLEPLAASLREARLCNTLEEAVEALCGPIINRRQERDDLQTRWQAFYAETARKLLPYPPLCRWLEAVQQSGTLRRYGLDEALRLRREALQLLGRLPASGISLAELAASTLGDAHALDRDRPLGTLMTAIAATLGGVDRQEGNARDAWASVGVLLDELSAPVLVFNLRAADDGPTSRVLAIYADAGEPCFLTTRQLLRNPPRFDPAKSGATVFVCENKNVAAGIANRLGARCAPLICTDGQPCTAVTLLLGQLRNAGIALRYHGDFDWPGIQIANLILTRHRATPWRMGADDYRRAASGQLQLKGPPVRPIWDETLYHAMLEIGTAVHEEQVSEVLLADLEREHLRHPNPIAGTSSNAD